LSNTTYKLKKINFQKLICFTFFSSYYFFPFRTWLPIALTCLFAYSPNFKRNKLNQVDKIAVLLFVIFCATFVIGYDNLIFFMPTKYYLPVVLLQSGIVFFFSLQMCAGKDKPFLALQGICVGILSHVVLCILFTAMIANKLFLYGDLQNPFFDGFLRSSLLSNYIIIIFCIVLCLFKKSFKKYFEFLVIFLCGIGLGARTFLLICLPATVSKVIFFGRKKIFMPLLIFLSFLVGILFAINNYHPEFFDFYIKKGIDSERWELLKYANNNWYRFVFGGMQVPYNLSSEVGSFHNLFVDSYRLGGVITFLPLVITFLFLLFYTWNQKALFFCIIGITAVMLQDSIFEGGHKQFITFLCIIILGQKNRLYSKIPQIHS